MKGRCGKGQGSAQAAHDETGQQDSRSRVAQLAFAFGQAFHARVADVVQQGAQGQVRASWDFGVPGQYAYAMEVSGDGTHWMRFMDATYSRDS